MSRETDIAWAAGLFEGEGCITHQPDRPHQIRLQLGSTDHDVVERFAEIVGCGSISVSNRSCRLTDNPKPLWMWAAVSNNAASLLNVLLPYLGSRRTLRAQEAIARRANHIAYATRERPCSYCGQPFRPEWNSGSTRKRFCCEAHQRAAAHRREYPLYGPRLCQLCGNEFIPIRGTKIYCSTLCRTRVSGKRRRLREAA